MRTTAGPPSGLFNQSASDASSPSIVELSSGGGKVRAAGGGRFATTLSLDAVRSPKTRAPAHLHDAHSASFTTDCGGPIPRTAVIGRMFKPGGALSVSSSTHPPTRRPVLRPSPAFPLRLAR